jgi:hypothetical protein
VFDADTKQCRVDQDCIDKDFAKSVCVQDLCQPQSADPIWGCLDDPPLTTTGNPVSIQLEVQNATGRTPRTDAFVRVGSPFDSLCEEPIGDAVKVDVAGKANLQVADDFTGAPKETDVGGAGGFTNVKEGLALVTAKLNQPAPGRFVSEESGAPVFVRAG